MNAKGNGPIAVTGFGMVSSLGQGKAENWRRLSAGESGVRRLTRFPTDNLKTTIGASVDFLDIKPSGPNLSLEMARLAAHEALAESGIAQPGNFPGELFLAAPPIDMDWQLRFELAGPRKITDYKGLTAAAREAGAAVYDICINGGLAWKLKKDRLRLRRHRDPAWRGGDPPRLLRGRTLHRD